METASPTRRFRYALFAGFPAFFPVLRGPRGEKKAAPAQLELRLNLYWNMKSRAQAEGLVSSPPEAMARDANASSLRDGRIRSRYRFDNSGS